MTLSLDQLVLHIDELLQPGRFKDYCPNGLQVQGRASVERIATGVTASQALVDAAIRLGCRRHPGASRLLLAW